MQLSKVAYIATRLYQVRGQVTTLIAAERLDLFL